MVMHAIGEPHVMHSELNSMAGKSDHDKNGQLVYLDVARQHRSFRNQFIIAMEFWRS